MNERDFLLTLIELKHEKLAIDLINSGRITDKDLNNVGSYTNMVLHLAVKNDLTSLVKFLLTETCTNPNLLSDDSENFSPLMIAVSLRHVEIIELLMSAKADPDLTNKYKVKALDYASRNKYMIAKLLLPRVLIEDTTHPLKEADEESLDDTVEMSGESQ